MKKNQGSPATSQDPRNNIFALTAKVYITREDDHIIYRFIDAMLWNPTIQNHESLSHDPDKFTITAEDFETAKSEFWFRWNQYSKRRFGHSIPLDLTWI